MKKEQVNKLPKGIDQTFVDAIQALSIDQLKARIVEIQLQNEENELFKESTAYLEAKSEYDYAKERHNEVVGPIKETTSILKSKTKLIIDRLKDKGGA